jgi:hypothetical protein
VHEYSCILTEHYWYFSIVEGLALSITAPSDRSVAPIDVAHRGTTPMRSKIEAARRLFGIHLIYCHIQGGTAMKRLACAIVLCGILFGCGPGGSQLTGNVSIVEFSANAPQKDQVVISVLVSNGNDTGGTVTVAAEVNAGTVTWREKRVRLFVPAQGTARAEVNFKGIQDRIPTMAKTFQYQARLYAGNRKLAETNLLTGSKPYGMAD